MIERQKRRVQTTSRVTRASRHIRRRAALFPILQKHALVGVIEFLADKPMTGPCRVNADLIGAAREGLRLKQAVRR